MSRSRRILSLCLALSASCSPPPASNPKNLVDTTKVIGKDTKRTTRAAPRREAPLSAFIPGAGLEWLLQVRPRSLLRTPGFVDSWSLLLKPERLRAFGRASGVDPYQVKELWIAAYPSGLLYLFDSSRVGDNAEAAFRRRASKKKERAIKAQAGAHLTGWMDGVPYSFLRIAERFVAIAQGDTQLTRKVQGYAEDRLKRSKPALRGRFLFPLRNHERTSPLRLFAFGPYTKSQSPAARLFVSGVLAFSFSGDELRIKAKSLGFWPPEPDPAPRLDAWLEQRFASSEFAALGLSTPLRRDPIACLPFFAKSYGNEPLSLCSSSGTWNSSELANTIHRITSAPMSGLLEPTLSPAPSHTSPIHP